MSDQAHGSFQTQTQQPLSHFEEMVINHVKKIGHQMVALQGERLGTMPTYRNFETRAFRGGREG